MSVHKNVKKKRRACGPRVFFYSSIDRITVSKYGKVLHISKKNEHIYMGITTKYGIRWFKLLAEPLGYIKCNNLHRVIAILFSTPAFEYKKSFDTMWFTFSTLFLLINFTLVPCTPSVNTPISLPKSRHFTEQL